MNKPSGKISPEENNKVFQMLGDRRQSLSTAVVQLLLANQGPTRQWQLVVTGIACFVKDSVRRGYFIQVFDMDNCQRIWEQELYNEMIYKNPTSTFHTFEGDSTTVGLSFADNREAEEFKAAVIERLEKLKSRAERRKHGVENKKYSPEMLSTKNSDIAIDYNGNVKTDEIQPDKKEQNFGRMVKRYCSLKRKKNRTKPKLTKDDISLPAPESFVHINGLASSNIHNSNQSDLQKSKAHSGKRPPSMEMHENAFYSSKNDPDIANFNESSNQPEYNLNYNLNMGDGTKDDISLPAPESFVHTNGLATFNSHNSNESDLQKSKPTSEKRRMSETNFGEGPPPPPPPMERHENAFYSSKNYPDIANFNEPSNQPDYDLNYNLNRKKSGPPTFFPPSPPPPPPPPPPLKMTKSVTNTTKTVLPPIPTREPNIDLQSNTIANLMEEIRNRGGVRGNGLRQTKTSGYQENMETESVSKHETLESRDTIDSKYKPKSYSRIPPPPPPPPNTPASENGLPCNGRIYFHESPSRLAKTNSSFRCNIDHTKNGLLEEIRQKGGYQGGNLKHVLPSDRKLNSDNDSTSSGSLYNVFQGALTNIRYATCNSDSSESSGTEDEWSEDDC